MIAILVNLFLLYLLIGFFFALIFVIWGVQRLDDGAKGASWGFRMLILPGTILFWPVLLTKWIRSTSQSS